MEAGFDGLGADAVAGEVGDLAFGAFGGLGEGKEGEEGEDEEKVWWFHLKYCDFDKIRFLNIRDWFKNINKTGLWIWALLALEGYFSSPNIL